MFVVIHGTVYKINQNNEFNFSSNSFRKVCRNNPSVFFSFLVSKRSNKRFINGVHIFVISWTKVKQTELSKVMFDLSINFLLLLQLNDSFTLPIQWHILQIKRIKTTLFVSNCSMTRVQYILRYCLTVSKWVPNIICTNLFKNGFEIEFGVGASNCCSGM